MSLPVDTALFHRLAALAGDDREQQPADLFEAVASPNASTMRLSAIVSGS
jgi:hypothetical protein